jgi:putative NIF3 family GTP cyclohydrolase 1 type 2
VTTVGAILDYVRSLNPRGELGREEGVLYGETGAEVSGIVVAWMATTDAIARTISEGCQVLLCHEALWFHDYFASARSDAPWTADRARRSLLEDTPITVIRAHSTVDPTHVVPGFIRAVGLPPSVKQGNVWSFHQVCPMCLADLAAQVASGLGMGGLRVTGDPERQVSRVGTMVGGLGLDRHLLSWEEHLMGLDVEVVIAGETNDFAQRFAIDSGVALIETCHSASEEPGLAALASDMAPSFPGVRIVFLKQVIPWNIV